MPDPRILVFRPWPDPVYDRYDQAPTGEFSRQAWLPTVGPTCWVLWGIVADQLTFAGSVTWQLDDLANAVGVNMHRHRHNDRIVRTLQRLCQFRLFDRHGDVFDVRLSAPPLTGRRLERLPASVADWQSQLFPVRHAPRGRRP